MKWNGEENTENEMNDNNNSSSSKRCMPSEMKMNEAQRKDNWIIVNLETIAAAAAAALSLPVAGIEWMIQSHW